MSEINSSKLSLWLRYITLSLILLFGPTQWLYANQACAELKKVAVDNAVIRRPLSSAKKRYPKNINPEKSPDGNLMVGFESEYMFSEAGELLNVYGPTEAHGMSKDTWLAKSVDEKLEWLNANKKVIFPDGPGSGQLEKLVDSPENNSLPKQLILDETGNLEIVLDPFNTLEELFTTIYSINKRFGPGSMQAMVSVSRESFFADNPANNIGFFRMMGEFDAMDKLVAGARKYGADSSKPSLLSFTHQWLGPATNIRLDSVQEFLDHNQRGEWYEKTRLSAIKNTDSSLKYFGSTVYRPDIASPTRVAMEVRDAHKSEDQLRKRVLRASFFTLEGRSMLKGADKLVALNPVKDFAKLPTQVQTMLKKIFPSRAKAELQYDEGELLALEVSRNFAFPLKDWSEHLKFFDGESTASKVNEAQSNFVAQMTAVAKRHENGEVSDAVAAIEAQGLVAQFSIDSGLANMMTKWYESNVIDSEAYQKFARDLPLEIAEGTK